MTNNKLDVRVYPIDEPKGSTLAFASIAVDGMVAIRGVRIVDSDKGVFVSMPQSQDNSGKFHDIAFPLSGDLRKEINEAVLGEFEAQANLVPEERGYEKPEQGTANIRSADEIILNVKVFPLAEQKGDTLAFASVGFDDDVAIRGIRVVNSEKGPFVSMPQSKDKEGNFHDIAFPLSGELRKAVSTAIIGEYKYQVAEKKQSIGERLAEGAEQAAQFAANAPARSVAKKAPGLGD